LLVLLLLPLAGCTAVLRPETLGVRTPTAEASPAPQETPSLTAGPTRTATLAPSPTVIPTEEPLILVILYDNNPYDERLRTSWGFSCFLERGDLRILFDTGADSSTLLANMATLGIDPGGLDAIVLSHIHGDHVGGLDGVLAANEDTTVYVPQSFPSRFKDDVGGRARLVEVGEPMRIAEGVQTTGEMGRAIREQALIVSSAQGAIVITGCSHPGIVEIVARAKKVSGEPIDLVMGGFHLSGTGKAGIKSIVEAFQRMGVRRVAPTHCSGDLAREMFAEAYGDQFIRAGVGLRLEIQP